MRIFGLLMLSQGALSLSKLPWNKVFCNRGLYVVPEEKCPEYISKFLEDSLTRNSDELLLLIEAARKGGMWEDKQGIRGAKALIKEYEFQQFCSKHLVKS